MTLRTGTRSMWTTPPSVDVGVQLVSGTAEMEALMACSPVDTLSSNSNNNNSSCHRNESKDKQQSSPLSGPIITDEESITVNRFDCINSGTNESHGILMNASIHNTAPTSVEPSTNASSPVSNTRHLSKHVSRRHRHQGSSSKINESMTMGQKIVRQTNSSHGTSNTKRKPFYIRYW
ncbi:hypothetical protein BDF19DRAFT_104098 [Syncephalis fuscata]|nr:hypothetical protein BDF19DRAFT_104098 [Syncephalis fuscata]